MVKMTWERGGARVRWEEEEGGHMHVWKGVVITFCNLVRHFSVAHGCRCVTESEDSVAHHGWCATDRKSTRLNSSHRSLSRMPSSA